MPSSLRNIGRRSLVAVTAAAALLMTTGVAYATHTWGGYHWARTTSSFTLKLGDNVNSTWDSYLRTSSTDWSVSTVLDTTVVAGNAGKNCRPTAGRVEICNKKYGANGWLGIASVWVSGTHITQATVKMNDTYFNTASYNTPAWRNLVMCQEIGHTFGLDHQDEDFSNANLGTCMDYTNNPSTNQHPNVHDYEELGIIYGHLDTTTTVGSETAPSSKNDVADTDGPAQWGKIIRKGKNGKPSVYERDVGGSQKVYTFVIWADQKDEH